MLLNPKEINKLVEQELAALKLNGQPQNLYEPINYILSLGAKRTRPAMVLMACNLFADELKHAIPVALGVEVFHNFTLLHDDIMDNAPLRRGNSTVHEKWNTNIAILSGDTMLVKAYQLIMQCPDHCLRQVMDLFSKTAIEVCEGQQLDMNFETQVNVSIPQYINMIRLKTAVLLASSLKMGAYAGGAKEEDAQYLYKFGENIGIAFQLQDDILDVYGDAETFGKQVGGDIIANKKTYLLLKALQIAHKYQKEELENWMLVSANDATAKVKAIIAIYDALNIRKLAEQEMQRYYQLAIDNLTKVLASDERKIYMEQFAKKLMIRES